MTEQPEYSDEDMAVVGRALMETLHHNHPHWMPADCPSEIVVDLLNEIHDLKGALTAILNTTPEERQNPAVWFPRVDAARQLVR